jgi:transcriptional regulator with XRE-family HTH domain
MDRNKRKALESAGFRVGDAADFLGLTEEEAKLVDLRVRMSQLIRQRREAQHLSQRQVAAKLKTSQPRIAKIEAAAADVSLDQMFRSLHVLGGSIDDLVSRRGAGSSKKKSARRSPTKAESATTSPARAKAAKKKAGDPIPV